MSAECFKHGCDLVYPADSDTMVGVCQVCEHEAEVDRLRIQLAVAESMIPRHQLHIYEALRAAKAIS